ncbi:MFS transporter [Methylogaea oryzae]|uniref:MFS transporter n=1 Tax=Methylogaea oryzae TaxID=1295382 RepID=UPI001C3F319F|nr:MFS transporter [Methylogaea oryzae]
MLPLLVGRALRAFADGYVAVLLPVYLLALGFDTWQVGFLSSATLLGTAATTLAVGAWGHRFQHRRLLLAAALLMALTGFAFAAQSAFWPLLLIAFFGTLNPSSGDVSLFVPLEHARLAEAAHGEARTALFARYSLLGSLFAALGAWPSHGPIVSFSWRAWTGSMRSGRCSRFTVCKAAWCGCYTGACRRCMETSRRRRSRWDRPVPWC